MLGPGPPAVGKAAAPPTSGDRPSAGALVKRVERVNAFAAAAHSENTRRGYSADWRSFEAWCEKLPVPALPASPESVALYLSDLAGEGRKVSTVRRALAAISQAHKAKGVPSPRSSARVATTMRGIARTLGVAPVEKAPVLVPALRSMTAILPAGLLGLRDRALLVLGFAGGFRRSELVGLDVADLEFRDEGLDVTLRRSKTDQEGKGRKVAIVYGSNPATCPVRAVRVWLKEAKIETGPVFRHVHPKGRVAIDRLAACTVARIVKRYAVRIGLEKEKYAGHSLRAGLVTSAAKAGKSERAIMDLTGHRSSVTVRRYIRDAERFNEHNAGVGLL